MKVCDNSKGSPEWFGNTTMCCMAMGTRQSEQASLWVASAELPKSPGHPFYTRLNALLDADDFDRFVEGPVRQVAGPVEAVPLALHLHGAMPARNGKAGS